MFVFAYFFAGVLFVVVEQVRGRCLCSTWQQLCGSTEALVAPHLIILLLQPSANLEHVLLGRLFAAVGRSAGKRDGAPRSARTLKPSSVLKLGGDSGPPGPPVPADSATVSVAPVFDGRSINAGN